MHLADIQSALAQRGFDAWPFYDHHHRDPIAYRILGLPEDVPVSRRWFYLIPRTALPQNWSIVSSLGTWTPLRELSGVIQRGTSCWINSKRCSPLSGVEMQYSSNNLIFYVGMVDAGTIEMIRGFGHEIVSSGDLVAQFEAALSDEQICAHFRPRDKIDLIKLCVSSEH
jgi:hypothetical protein